MNNKDLNRIKDMAMYCADIAKTIERFGNDQEIFFNDIDYRNSIAMSIMQIGELSVKLTDEFKDRTKEQVQWNSIRGMRNMFAHNYSDMNESIIWSAAIQSVPELLEFCNQIIAKSTHESSL
jgi:uncharacterized protein with HEPN domain